MAVFRLGLITLAVWICTEVATSSPALARWSTEAIAPRCQGNKTEIQEFICNDITLIHLDDAISDELDRKKVISSEVREEIYARIYTLCNSQKIEAEARFGGVEACMAEKMLEYLATHRAVDISQFWTPLPEGVIHPYCIVDLADETLRTERERREMVARCHENFRHIPVAIHGDGTVGAGKRSDGQVSYKNIGHLPNGDLVIYYYENNGSFEKELNFDNNQYSFLVFNAPEGSGFGMFLGGYRQSDGYKCKYSINNYRLEGSELIIYYNIVTSDFQSEIGLKMFHSLNSDSPEYCFGRVKYKIELMDVLGGMQQEPSLVGLIVNQDSYYFANIEPFYDGEGEENCIARVLKREGFERLIPIAKFSPLRRELTRRCRPNASRLAE